MKSTIIVLLALTFSGCVGLRVDRTRQDLLNLSMVVPANLTDTLGPHTGPVEGEMHRLWKTPDGAMLHIIAYPDQVESFLGPVDILGFKPVSRSQNVIMMRTKWYPDQKETASAILVNKTDGYVIITEKISHAQFEDILRTVRFR